MTGGLTSQEDRETDAEIERLRARVEMLEAQLADVEAWASHAVADAQIKTYWLDRWHVDLNALMRRRSADRARAAVRKARSVYRVGRRIRRRISS
jgi:hypothetical protein